MLASRVSSLLKLIACHEKQVYMLKFHKAHEKLAMSLRYCAHLEHRERECVCVCVCMCVNVCVGMFLYGRSGEAGENVNV